MDALYTPTNCTPAYELRWSLALFPSRQLPPQTDWIGQLTAASEPDGVRVLECHHRPPSAWQFLLSTTPAIAPPAIVKSVKGRLQHLLHTTHPGVFRRNFSLASVGDARQDVVERYVAGQLGHHQMADPHVQERLRAFQLAFPEVDLAEPQFSSHGRYVYNLHLALVHEARWCEVREERLAVTRTMTLAAARKKQHRLSRASFLADHLHLTMGCRPSESPEEIALGYLNNLAYAHGMRPLFCYSYYVGTFGTYDMGAIRRSL